MMRILFLALLCFLKMPCISQVFKIQSDLDHKVFFSDNLQIEDLGIDTLNKLLIYKYDLSDSLLNDSTLIKEYNFHRYKSYDSTRYFQSDFYETIQYTKRNGYNYIESRSTVKLEENSYIVDSKLEYYYPYSRSGGFDLKEISYLINNDSLQTLRIVIVDPRSLYESIFLYKYYYDNGHHIIRCEQFHNNQLEFQFKYFYYR